MSNERYRVDPSVSLNGGELRSGAVSGGRHYLPEDGVQLQTGSSRIIDFATKLRRVSIADTTVAEIMQHAWARHFPDLMQMNPHDAF